MLCSLAYTRTYQIRIMFLCLVCVSCINKNVAFIYSNQKRSLLSFIVRLTIDMCKLIHVSLQLMLMGDVSFKIFLSDIYSQ